MKYATAFASIIIIGLVAGDAQAQWSSSSSSNVRSRSVERFRSKEVVQPVRVQQFQAVHPVQQIKVVETPVVRRELVEVEREVPVTRIEKVRVQEERSVVDVQRQEVLVQSAKVKSVKSSSYDYQSSQRNGLLGRLRGGRGLRGGG